MTALKLLVIFLKNLTNSPFNLRLGGIEHVLQFTAVEKQVFLRSYKIHLKKSGGRIPRYLGQQRG